MPLVSAAKPETEYSPYTVVGRALGAECAEQVRRVVECQLRASTFLRWLGFETYIFPCSVEQDPPLITSVAIQEPHGWARVSVGVASVRSSYLAGVDEEAVPSAEMMCCVEVKHEDDAPGLVIAVATIDSELAQPLISNLTRSRSAVSTILQRPSGSKAPD